MSVFDTLTTWIFDSKKCKGGVVRHYALMPELIDGRWETSAYGCCDMAPADIWAQNTRTDKDAKGRAVYQSSVFDTLDGLVFEEDGLPSLHGNVIGWSAEKDEQMEIAKEWADECKFIPYPE